MIALLCYEYGWVKLKFDERKVGFVPIKALKLLLDQFHPDYSLKLQNL